LAEYKDFCERNCISYSCYSTPSVVGCISE
jgi:hypothetical protein